MNKTRKLAEEFTRKAIAQLDVLSSSVYKDSLENLTTYNLDRLQ
ncbi:MAG: hypothetical protein AAGC99_11855 [Pseudomonadota bacterium]